MKFKISFSVVFFSLGLIQGVGQQFLAQDTCTYTLQGTILDVESKDPLPYVSVGVKGGTQSTHTGLDGKFLLTGLCQTQNTLIIKCFGYCDSICQHHHTHGHASQIYLTPDILEMEGVVIKVEKNQEEGTLTNPQITLKKEELMKDPTQSLAAALEGQAGITMSSNGTNLQIPVIHGLRGNRILVLNNGLRQGFQNWGGDHAPEIDLSAIHSVTVLKGAAGVKYGPEALGGVILTEPNPMYLNEPFQAAIGTGFQTNGRGLFTHLSLSQGKKKWSYYAHARLTQIGDRNTPDYSLTNTGKKENSFSGGFRYLHHGLDLKLHYSRIDQNLGLLRASVFQSGQSLSRAIESDRPEFVRPFSYEIKEPNQLTTHHLAKAQLDWWYTDHSKLSFTLGAQVNNRKEFDVRRNAQKPIIDLGLTTMDYQLAWTHPQWKKIHGEIGLQAFTQVNDNNPGTGTTPFIPNYRTSRVSAYAIEHFTKGPTDLEFGIRLDRETNSIAGRQPDQAIFSDAYSFLNLTTSLGFKKTINARDVLQSHVGTAWRAPNLAELYSFGQRGFQSSFGLLRYTSSDQDGLSTRNVTDFLSSDVQSEKGYKWINEWHRTTKKHRTILTAYAQYIQNYIYTRPIDIIGTIRGPLPVFVVQQANSLFFGSDFSWKTDWTKQLSSDFSVSYLWSRNIENKEALINQSPLTASYKLTYQTKDFWKIKASELSLKPSYTFRQFQAPRTISPSDLIENRANLNTQSEIFDLKDAPKGYLLLHFSWGFELGAFQTRISVQNLLNTRYRDYLNELRYFADEQGRNVQFSIQYKFKSKSIKQ